ncbi:integrase catalytic domain-containing protein [Trichonephila clavipes]|nr:integrase catalytic domain-containing protein [Trichonephila clavipes]
MRNLYRYQKDSYLKTGCLSRLYQKVNLEKLKNVEELNPISWKFIPPQAPWWGGFWERLIGLVKKTLRKTLGKTSLNHEELHTVLCDCESLINSRPLTYVTDDVEDLEPLTPAMFLQDIREVDANEGSHLPIIIDPELSKHQRVATSSMQPCSSISNGGAGLEPRAETSRHQQAETSSMQLCSSISNGGAGLEPRAETSRHQQAETSSMQPCSSISNGLMVELRQGGHQQWTPAETSSMQPCSSISNGGAGLEPRAETSGHQQAETSSM